MLKLIDINDYISDEQIVKLVAYNITIYEGDALHIPAGYCKYPLVPQKTHVEDNKLVIEMDC